MQGIVALLHDVVEDTSYSLKYLENIAFPKLVIHVLVLLTHKQGIPYMDHVAWIKEDPITRAVKLADLKHNSDMSRLDFVGEKAIQRVQKYEKAIALLCEPNGFD